MQPSDSERIWAAGFFDGEGWISVNRVRSGNYLRMAVAGTVLYPLERFQAAVGGVGRISGPYQGKRPGRDAKAVWYWRASSAEARQAVEAIQPWLCQHSLDKIDKAERQVMTYR